MGIEIERKFLVKDDSWRGFAEGKMIRQGFLSINAERVVRVRSVDDKGYLTVKGISAGSRRTEFEYVIPEVDANEMLDNLCLHPLIEKIRYRIEYGGLIWEIDEFLAENKGLIVAEVELKDENCTLPIPDWIGIEVTDDPRYFNNNLVKQPYSTW